MKISSNKYDNLIAVLKALGNILIIMVFTVNSITIPVEESFAIEIAPAIGLGITQPGMEKPGENFINLHSIPEHLGRIIHSSGTNPEKILLHIQDAHSNYACQSRIAEIINYFVSEYNVDVINMEGGSGEYDLSAFTEVENPAIRREIGDFMMTRGEMNGAEFYAINNSDRVKLWGIENKEAYLKNLDVYRESLIYKPEVDEYLKQLNTALNRLKMMIFSKDLVNFVLKYNGYKRGDVEFEDYFNFLIRKSSKYPGLTSSYPNLTVLNECMEMEENIDFKKSNKERDDLVNRLKKKLSRAELKDLAIMTLDFKRGSISKKKFYTYLIKKASDLKLNMRNYGAIQDYIYYIEKYESIDMLEVMDEIEALENKLVGYMFRTPKEKELYEISRIIILLENMFDLRFTRKDYQYYLDDPGRFSVNTFLPFIKNTGMEYGETFEFPEDIKKLDDYTGHIRKFYEYSFDRDRAFIENLKFTRSATGSERAILLTGGFHTENMCDLLAKNNISYISVLPKFSMEKEYENPYFDQLKGYMTPLVYRLKELIIAGQSAIQIASKLSALGDDVWGRDGVAAYKGSVRLLELFKQEHPEVPLSNIDSIDLKVENGFILADFNLSSGEMVTVSKSENELLSEAGIEVMDPDDIKRFTIMEEVFIGTADDMEKAEYVGYADSMSDGFRTSATLRGTRAREGSVNEVRNVYQASNDVAYLFVQSIEDPERTETIFFINGMVKLNPESGLMYAMEKLGFTEEVAEARRELNELEVSFDFGEPEIENERVRDILLRLVKGRVQYIGGKVHSGNVVEDIRVDLERVSEVPASLENARAELIDVAKNKIMSSQVILDEPLRGILYRDLLTGEAMVSMNSDLDRYERPRESADFFEGIPVDVSIGSKERTLHRDIVNEMNLSMAYDIIALNQNAAPGGILRQLNEDLLSRGIKGIYEIADGEVSVAPEYEPEIRELYNGLVRVRAEAEASERTLDALLASLFYDYDLAGRTLETITYGTAITDRKGDDQESEKSIFFSTADESSYRNFFLSNPDLYNAVRYKFPGANMISRLMGVRSTVRFMDFPFTDVDIADTTELYEDGEAGNVGNPLTVNRDHFISEIQTKGEDPSRVNGLWNDMLKFLLGGKGWGLVDMTDLGVNVPEYFTITTNMHRKWMSQPLRAVATNEILRGAVPVYGSEERTKNNVVAFRTSDGREYAKNEVTRFNEEQLKSLEKYFLAFQDHLRKKAVAGSVEGLPQATAESIQSAINAVDTEAREAGFSKAEKERMVREAVEKVTGKGDTADRIVMAAMSKFPVSVRSGAPVSMPGAMDTLLNVTETGDYLRAVEEVFLSYYSKPAVAERKDSGISENMGTAVNIQRMVFSNDKDARDSGFPIDQNRSIAGVIFTADANTGDVVLGGHFGHDKGEKIVSADESGLSMEFLMESPEGSFYRTIGERLQEITNSIVENEDYYPQDIEFVVETRARTDSRGRILYITDTGVEINSDMLEGAALVEDGEEYFYQTDRGRVSTQINMRTGEREAVPLSYEPEIFILQKRNAPLRGMAAYNLAKNLVEEDRWTEETALEHMEKFIADLESPRLDKRSAEEAVPLTSGIRTSAGAVRGRIAFSRGKIEELHDSGDKVIYISDRPEVRDEDALAAEGVINTGGGSSSHAAVVYKNKRKPAIVGAKEFRIDIVDGQPALIHDNSGTILREGDEILMDGESGNVYITGIEDMNISELKIDWKNFVEGRPSTHTWENFVKDVDAAIYTGEGVSMTEAVFAEGMVISRGIRTSLGSNERGAEIDLDKVIAANSEGKDAELAAYFEGVPLLERTVTVAGKTVKVTIDSRLGDAATGLTPARLEDLIYEALTRSRGNIDILPERLFIARLEDSSHAFENHTRDGFIGINRNVLGLEANIRDIVLDVGLVHEFSHEVTGKLTGAEAEAFEAEQLKRDVLFAGELIMSNGDVPPQAIADGLRVILSGDNEFVPELEKILGERPAELLEKSIVDSTVGASTDLMESVRPGTHTDYIVFEVTEDQRFWDGQAYSKLTPEIKRKLQRKFGSNVRLYFLENAEILRKDETEGEEVNKIIAALQQDADARVTLYVAANNDTQFDREAAAAYVDSVKAVFNDVPDGLAAVVPGNFLPDQTDEEYRFSLANLAVMALGIMEMHRLPEAERSEERGQELGFKIKRLFSTMVSNSLDFRSMDPKEFINALFTNGIFMDIRKIDYEEIRDYIAAETAVLESL